MWKNLLCASSRTHFTPKDTTVHRCHSRVRREQGEQKPVVPHRGELDLQDKGERRERKRRAKHQEESLPLACLDGPFEPVSSQNTLASGAW